MRRCKRTSQTWHRQTVCRIKANIVSSSIMWHSRPRHQEPAADPTADLRKHSLRRQYGPWHPEPGRCFSENVKVELGMRRAPRRPVKSAWSSSGKRGRRSGDGYDQGTRLMAWELSTTVAVCKERSGNCIPGDLDRHTRLRRVSRAIPDQGEHAFARNRLRPGFSLLSACSTNSSNDFLEEEEGWQGVIWPFFAPGAMADAQGLHGAGNRHIE